MAKKAPPSFDFYPEDWLTSPRVLGMLPEQEGAYIHLLAIIANTESCCIAGDERSLATASRLNSRWKRLGSAVRDCFMACPEHPERITNEKLWGIRQGRLAYSQKQSKSGAHGANKRWGKHGKPHRGANGVAIESPQSRPYCGDGHTDGDPNGESIARSLPSSQRVFNRSSQKHRVQDDPPRPGGAVQDSLDDPDPDGTLTLTIEQQRLVNELRDLTGETDRAGLYRAVVARLEGHVFRVLSELRQAINDRSSRVENRGALFVEIAKRVAAEVGIVLFPRRAA